MYLTIKEKTYSYTPDYQTNTTTWKIQAGAFFKFPVLIGGVNCFVKRFVNMPCGWDLVRDLVGESHPHLPEIYAASTETEDQKTVFYLVTSFLEGGILSEILTQRQTQNVDKLAADVLKALAIIHQKGFWFADFCEKNIFWASQFNRFMLIDLDSCEPLHTRPHYAPNEPGYMPAQDFAAPTISFFKNILHTPNFNFHSLRGNLMNFCQLIFMSAKIGYFKNLLAQDPKTPFAAAKKIELPTHLLTQFAGNELFIKKVFEKIGEGLVNSEQLLQICDRFIPSSFAALLLNSKPFETPKPQNPINADWWNGLDDTWKNIFRKHCKKKEGAIAFFEEIYNLQILDCSYNKISSLEPLKYLMNLQELNCGNGFHYNKDTGSQICSLELASIGICLYNEISSLEPLKYLKNLQVLNCNHNKISSLEPLAYLKNLQVLNCLQNQISSLEPLTNLVNLQELYCGNNEIISLEPLTRLVNLQILNCGNDISWNGRNQISSLEPLTNLTNLKIFGCEYNQIFSLEPLTNLTNLKILYFRASKTSSLEPLTNLVNLQELYCGFNPISNLEPLTNLVNLQILNCWGSPISSLEPLTNLTNLQMLNCGKKQIADVQIQSFQAAHPKCKISFENLEASDWVWIEQGDDYGDEEDWIVFDNESDRTAAEEDWEGFLRDQEQSDFDNWYNQDPDNW